MTNLDSIFKSRDITLPTKVRLINGFSSGHVWMWELECEESWVLKNWCFWTVVLEKTLESPLECKEIQPVHPKGNQSWIFIGRTDVEVETPILWPSDAKNWLIWKDPDAGQDWRWEEKGMTEDEMVVWHHQLNGYEFEQTPGDSEGQGSLACCSPRGRKESDRTERQNWTDRYYGRLLVFVCFTTHWILLYSNVCGFSRLSNSPILCRYLMFYNSTQSWYYLPGGK